jgi:uncharacterized cupredoxin-like copper-binding protein
MNGSGARGRVKAIGGAMLFAAVACIGDAAGTDAANGATHTHVHNAQTPFGIAGQRHDVSRTFEIRMLDEMRFVPDRIDVRQGDTVRLVLTNTGRLPHEFVMGTRKDLARHAEMMMASGIAHDEPSALQVSPGKTGEIVWKFNRAGRFDFACLVAGHYQAGMAGTINVKSR